MGKAACTASPDDKQAISFPHQGQLYTASQAREARPLTYGAGGELAAVTATRQAAWLYAHQFKGAQSLPHRNPATVRGATSTSSTSKHHKEFPNGDNYTGGWKDGLPEGEGIYQWADGSVYEGSWKNGAKQGLGTYTWPTKAVYRGEWQNGCMHGSGTFEGTDGTRYQGGWQRDLKHGLGKKWYANGDTYEGLWKAGKSDGPGRYKWKNRNEYDGEWRAGKMHGQGTLKWNTGDRYDGEFKDGEEDGLGVFTWPDSSTYDGFWRNGKKHGIGVYRPAEQTKRQTTAFEHVSAASSVTLPHADMAEESVSERPVPNPSVSGPASASLDAPREAQAEAEYGRTGSTGRNERAETVYIREYEDGRLIREDPVSGEELDAVFGPFKRRLERRNRRRMRKGDTVRPGETIYKGHRSYDLMLNLQLGIRYSVGKITPDPRVSKLTDEHFRLKVKQFFPRDGSKATPPHPSADFRWKDYCPMAFRKLREVFNIDAAEYMLSICGDQALRELPSPGKSGSVFFLSNDDKFIIKTMRKNEVKLLLDLLPKYHAHVEKHPHTLLIKFYGLHRVSAPSGSNVRFIVMNNLFLTDLQIHRKYDLKGSTQGRFSGKVPGPNTILKDLDLDTVFKLEEGWHDRLMWQLQQDCALLEDLKVMDYSLLLGVHHRSGGYTSSPPATDREDDDEEDTNVTPMSVISEGTPTAGASPLPRTLSSVPSGLTTVPSGFNGAVVDSNNAEMAVIQQRITKQLGYQISERRMADLIKLAQYKMLSRDPKTFRSPTMVLAMRPKRSDTMRPVAFSHGATDELTHSLGLQRVHLGINMASTAVPGSPEAGSQPEDVVLYFGIIDILQEYNLSKKLEHSFKALRHDGSAISAVDPRTYSRRFQEFMRRVFV
ncbi:hypothetical protein WJX72_000998 [[Myrmecia] bisecta]|uniref:1-phosphatidylinositol-4-phosphate 5-kinase n=1 Tax=[Myrmecia] bisecta TaxID=41462 RepID=A0AAW1Q4Z1_9CHLO